MGLEMKQVQIKRSSEALLVDVFSPVLVVEDLMLVGLVVLVVLLEVLEATEVAAMATLAAEAAGAQLAAQGVVTLAALVVQPLVALVILLQVQPLRYMEVTRYA